MFKHSPHHFLLSLFLLGLFIATEIEPVLSQLPASSSFVQNLPSIQLVEQGKDFYDNYRFQEAIAVWQQALRIYKNDRGNGYSALTSPSEPPEGNRLHQAMTLTYLCLAYQKLEQWAEAQGAIATSIEILDRSKLETQDSKLLLAQALNTRGSLELAIGQPEVALETWQLATKTYEQLGDRVGITGSLINQAQAMEALGLYRRTCKTLLIALNSDNSCDLSTPNKWKEIVQTFKQQQNDRLKLIGLRSLGNIFRLLGNLDYSQQILEESLKIVPSSTEEGLILLSLGKTQQALYKNTQNLSKRSYLLTAKNVATKQAIANAKNALKYYQKVVTASANLSHLKTIAIQAKLARLDLLIDFQQWLTSLDNQERNLNVEQLKSQINSQVTDLLNSQIASLPPSQTAIYAKLNLAQSLNKLKQNQQYFFLAIQYADRALKQAQEIENQRAESYALGILGNLYEQNQQWSKARELTERALILAQAIQAEDISARWQWQLGRIYQAQGKKQQAIETYNAAVITLNSTRKDLLAVSPEIQFSFRENVESVYRTLVDLLLETEKISELNQTNLQQAIQVMDSLQLAELEDFLSCDLSSTLALDRQEVDPNAAIIYPIILSDRIEVILRLSKSDKLLHYKTFLPQERTEQILESFRTQLEKRFISPDSLSSSQKVYDWLLRPAEDILRENKIETLVFVLDGEFRNLPMAALHDGKQYLIEQGYAIALMPSLKLLEPKPLARTPLNVLAFGLSQLKQNFPPHQGFAPLINVKTELEQINLQLPSQEFLDRQFTSQELQEKVSSLPSPIVHLATHGQFSSNPKETFILAWDKRIDLEDLSNLVRRRTQNSSEAIELLVLSACQTADGDSRATLGLAGVAIQSGARSTIASLWSIDDRSTAKLMSLFYRELAANNGAMTKAEALRRAQLELLHTSGYKAPFYWASYVLIGNWL
jgi:CHAT domain-containing protein